MTLTREQAIALAKARQRQAEQSGLIQPESLSADAGLSKPVATGRGIAGAQAQQRRQQTEEQLDVLRQQSDIPLARDLEEIGAAPEMNRLSLPSFLASAGALFTFDDKEVGDILQKQLGAEITQDAEGEFVAKMPSGQFFAINKPGLSGQDAAKLLASIGAFTPAGRAGSLTGAAAASAGTQAGIEAAQAGLGGEFDPGDVAVAGLAVPVVAKTLQGAGKTIQGLRNQFGTKGTGLITGESAATQAMRQAIEAGDSKAAGYMIDGANKVVKDKAARELMRQGQRTATFEPGKVSLFSGASKSDHKAFGKMLNIAQAGMKNAKEAALNRPGKVVGDTLIRRFNHVLKVNRQAGRDVSKAAQSLKGQSVDVSPARVNFTQSLDDAGITVNENNTLNYANSVFDGDAGSQKLLDALWRKTGSLEKSGDGLLIHNFKKFIDNQVDFGKKAAKPITAEAERLAKGLRAEINGVLRNASDDYKAANDVFSETIGALNDFRDVAGRNFNIDSPNVSEFVGKLSRRILSNAQSREPLIDSIHQLEKVGRRHGGQFDDDIATQLMFVEELEKTFGSFAPTSLQGEMAKAGRQALSGDRQGLVLTAAEKAVEKARGVNEDNALKALREFINRGSN